MTSTPPPAFDPLTLKMMGLYVEKFAAALPVMTELMSSLNWLRDNPVVGATEWNAWVKKSHDNTTLFTLGLNAYVETAKAAERYLSPG